LALAQKRRLREIPPDDGLIPVLAHKKTPTGGRRFVFELQTPEQIQRYCRGVMAAHDRREVFLRWGGNQWGEQWVCDPWSRELFQADQPLLKTDLPFRAWKEACES